ncbi:hypothetical protein KAW48_06165 [candidate division WOR-3 bacterium]|nr:hypothetical protein [candidate division WOR-3 bacterium]
MRKHLSIFDTLSASYQYDHYGRLVSEEYQDGSYNYSYLYDKVGNRLKSKGSGWALRPLRLKMGGV